MSSHPCEAVLRSVWYAVQPGKQSQDREDIRGQLVHVAEVRTGALRTVERLLSSVRGNLSTHLRRPGAWRQYFPGRNRPPRMEPLENLYCLRCNRELETGHKSVAVYMFAQTVGIRPRQKSAAQRICFCPQCSVSLAMGPPPEGALNIAAWNMIRDLVGADPALNQAAWENLRGIVGLLPATGTDGGPRRASAGGYFEF
jgi:hypothetical protein